MPRLTITNVEVTCSERSDYALGCECNGAGYHVWLDRKTRELRPKLYKNAIAPENYRTRYLRTDSKFGEELVRLMLDEANTQDLFRRAELKILEKQEEDRRQTTEAARIARIKEHAVELVDALKKAHTLVQMAYKTPQWLQECRSIESDDALVQIQMVLAKVEE